MIERTENAGAYAELADVELAERPHVRVVLAQARDDPTILDRAPRPKALLADSPFVVAAYVNHSRWIVDCPFEGCHSAQLATPEDPRFFCAGCRNAEAEGHYLPVSFPNAKAVAAIEAVLLERPVVETRNWFPHEKVRDLQHENAERL